MTNSDIAQRRLHTQHMAGDPLSDPVAVVGWLGAVQSQDYPGAKWSLGMRTPGFKESDLDRLFDDGAILRTHVMRPTWHFVTPEDIRWMLALTAPRVARVLASYDRKLGLDEGVLARSNALIADALKGGNFMTRPELMAVLQKAGIETDGTQRSAHLVMHAELDAIICSGPRRGSPADAGYDRYGSLPREQRGSPADAGYDRYGPLPHCSRGRQFTYALIEERAPQARNLSHDEALAELTRRYYTSHGPATVADFAWWSGLTKAEVRTGIDMVDSELAKEETDGQMAYFSASAGLPAQPSQAAILLPTYDEYIIGYTDRSAVIAQSWVDLVLSPERPAYDSMVVVGGLVIGTWRRTLKAKAAVVEIVPFTPFDAAQRAAVEAAAMRYGEFLGMPVELADGG